MNLLIPYKIGIYLHMGPYFAFGCHTPRQVRNAHHGRSDLTAVDNHGNIVLIEIKRDRKDIESRKEAFEFQAIRYAASYATIEINNTK